MPAVASQVEPLYELVTAADFAFSSTVKQNMKKALEEFQKEVSSCLCAPCQGNGVPVLKGMISRWLVCPGRPSAGGGGSRTRLAVKTTCPPAYLKRSFQVNSWSSASGTHVGQEALFIVSGK